MRTKLGLTETELMNTSWISLCLQMYDFPYWDSKAKKIVKGDKAASILDKYLNHV